MRLLFVFVFILGLVSCGEEKSSSSSSSDSSSGGESLGGEPMKQPNCDEIDGVTVKPDKYTGIRKKCKNGKVLFFKSYKNNVCVGLQRHWWSSTGNLKMERYMGGKGGEYIEGLYRMWHENGQIEYQANMRKGKPYGILREWYSNGQLKMEINYDTEERKDWDSNGNLIGS